MLDPKKIHELDQAIAGISDMFPRLMRNYHENLIEQGFNEAQAMYLTVEMQKVMIQSIYDSMDPR